MELISKFECAYCQNVKEIFADFIAQLNNLCVVDAWQPISSQN